MSYNRFAGYQRNNPQPPAPPSPATVVLTGDITGQTEVSSGETSVLAASVNPSSTGVNTIVSTTGDLGISNASGSVSLTIKSAPKWDTARTESFTGDATGGPTSVDGSANWSTALTLATVNSSPGPFGSATRALTATVNAKGLITAMSAIGRLDPVVAVSALGAATAGGRAHVTDSTVALAAGLGNIVAGSGTNYCPVYADGTNWRIG